MDWGGEDAGEHWVGVRLEGLLRERRDVALSFCLDALGFGRLRDAANRGLRLGVLNVVIVDVDNLLVGLHHGLHLDDLLVVCANLCWHRLHLHHLHLCLHLHLIRPVISWQAIGGLGLRLGMRHRGHWGRLLLLLLQRERELQVNILPRGITLLLPCEFTCKHLVMLRAHLGPGDEVLLVGSDFFRLLGRRYLALALRL